MTEKRATITSIVLLVFSLVIRAFTSFSKAYAQDDFYWGYLAWLRSTPAVPGRDYYLPNLTPLSELASPLFRWFPESFIPFTIARAVMLVIGIALVWACYRTARLLGGSVVWGLVAANVLTWQFQFMKRISDIRADQIAALCVMLSAIAILKRRAAWAGFACGVAVALAYKLLIAAPFLFAGAVAASPRRFRSAVSFCLAAAVAPVLYFGSRALIDGPDIILNVARGVSGALGSGQSYRWPSFWGALYTSPVTWVAFVAGCIGLWRARGDGRWYAVLGTAFLALFVYFNTFLFPYNYVILIPVLAPMVIGVARLLPTERLVRGAMFVIPMAAAGGGTFALDDIVNATNHAQEHAIRWIWKTTAANETFFDWQGTVAWRRSTYHWFLFSGVAPRYRSGWFSAEDEIRAAQVKIVLPNHRLRWMTARDAAFLRAHFVEADTCILVPGWILSRQAVLEGTTIDAFLVDEEYVVLGEVSGLLLDGQPAGRRMRVLAGEHRLSAAPGAVLPDRISILRLTPAMERSAPPCEGETMINPAS